MESVFSWQYDTLINELSQGKENAKQLRLHLYSTYPSEAHDLILQKILSSYDKALTILKWGGSSREAIPALGIAESSVSVDGSLEREDSNKNVMDHPDYVNASKKRKMQPTWTEQVKANSENGLEGPADDGYSWRKYGQKCILGAKYPRSYYRCTYRLVQNCWATKQVQRSDDDLTLFDMTYKGKHTCSQSANAVPLTASPEKQELRHHNADGFQQQNQVLSNLRASLRVDTEGLEDNEITNQFSFPSTFGFNHTDANNFPIPSLVDGNHQQSRFLSPAKSGSNCFLASTYQLKSWSEAPTFQQPEADIAEIISAHASATNSPIRGMEFIVDPIDLDPDFPFDTSEFFTYSNFEC